MMKSTAASIAILCVASLGIAFAEEVRAETVAPDIPGVVAGGTKVIAIKSGLNGTEGPVALPDGGIIFTETRSSIITKIDKDDNFTTFLENTNRSNGLGFDSKGRLISVQAQTVGVVYPKGSEVVLAGPYESRPNDLVVSKKDAIYFTLPGHTPPGVFYIPARGKAVFAAEAPSPHGIQLSPDEKVLYVADSYGESVVAFDVESDGRLTNRRGFGRYAGLSKVERGYDSHADGIAVDAEGRVYVGTLQGVQVFDPQGNNLGVIPVSNHPDNSNRPQNLAFAGPDKKTLYIVGGGVAYRVKMLAQGYTGRPK